MDMLGRNLKLLTHVNLSRFDCDTVIANGKMNTCDLHIGTGLWIAAIGIVGVCRSFYFHIEEADVI